MVNKNEKKVLEELEKQGWKVMVGSAPDFLCLKVNNGTIKDFKFVEVKAGNDNLTYEQGIYRKILKILNAKYEIKKI